MMQYLARAPARELWAGPALQFTNPGKRSILAFATYIFYDSKIEVYHLLPFSPCFSALQRKGRSLTAVRGANLNTSRRMLTPRAVCLARIAEGGRNDQRQDNLDRAYRLPDRYI